LPRKIIKHWDKRIFKQWIKVHKGCWLWQRTRNSGGYGVLYHDKTKWLAHRFACVLYGVCSETKLSRNIVRHTCDRGHEGCVNPRHLVLGTQQENVGDMVRRNRWRHYKQID